MILVDTSVWIAFLRSGEARLAAALEAGSVLMHPFVIGELACGHLSNREEILDLLAKLPAAPAADHSEALLFIQRHGLMGKGIGYIDVHLLASARLAGTARLWTMDKCLAAVAEAMDLAYTPER
jgi:predicted nucleic acid-binding protein